MAPDRKLYGQKGGQANNVNTISLCLWIKSMPNELAIHGAIYHSMI